jgi:hypothetical protein
MIDPRRRTLYVAVLGAAFILQILNYLWNMPRLIPPGFDAWCYLAAGRAIITSVSPYEYDLRPMVPEGALIVRGYLLGNAYLYPPLIGIMMIPLHGLHVSQAMLIWLGVVLALNVVLALALQPLVGPRIAWIAVFALLPTWDSWYNGQVNVIVAICYAIAIYDATRGYVRRGSAALVVGSLIKVTPVIGVALLVMRHPRRALPVSLLVGAGIIAATLSLVNLQTWVDGVLISFRALRTTTNMVSWGPLLRNLPGMAGSIAPLVLSSGLILATFLRARSIPLAAALAACSLIPVIAAPIVWGHHTMTILPALAVIWNRGKVFQRLAVSTWVVMNLPSASILLLVVLPLCWVALCWPEQIEAWVSRLGWGE